jgi:broad specificity phosphatase PhoE
LILILLNGTRASTKAGFELTSLKKRPEWELFRDGAPGGESPAQIASRAGRVVQKVRSIAGDVLLFSSGYFLGVLASHWIAAEPVLGKFFYSEPPA